MFSPLLCPNILKGRMDGEPVARPILAVQALLEFLQHYPRQNKGPLPPVLSKHTSKKGRVFKLTHQVLKHNLITGGKPMQVASFTEFPTKPVDASRPQRQTE